ncbi:MAG: hypothetical protein ACOCR0_00665 [Haloferacaceae archaeon]
MSDESADPRQIRSLAVHRDDVVTALEARERGRKPAVLRVVPPFSGRLRARLHVADTAPSRGEIHVQPSTFVADPPSYPHVDETADGLREDDSSDVERHRKVHWRAVPRWRETISEPSATASRSRSARPATTATK